MYTILRTELFDKWLSRLKDSRGKARIVKRIRSAERGNFGDCVVIGDSVSEMRIHSGSGYRVYFTRTGNLVYVLLCGGSKREQKKDIARAIALARELKEK
jgi:putative addiction module killer protein